MEHSISPRLEAKMLEMIGEVRTCPHGHPIGDYPREPGEALAGGARRAARSPCSGSRTRPRRSSTTCTGPASSRVGATRSVARSGDGEDAVTELEDDGGRSIAVEDRVARTVSVRVEERGDGPVSTLADASAELQLLGADRWGM